MLLVTAALVLMSGRFVAQPNAHGYPITGVNIKSVVLADSFWLPKIRMIQETTIPYAFDKCETEGRMENFLLAGRKKQGGIRGKMPFDDTDVYKIIEGASASLVSSPNPPLDAYIDSVIALIAIGQEPDGYLTTWFTVDRQHPPASWVKPSATRWEYERMSHELYNSGHLFEAAAGHYFATGKRNLLDIALKNADLLAANFGPGTLRRPPGHQIVETGLIRLYEITGRRAYLELAKFFLDARGDSTSHELYGDYSQDHLPVVRQEEAVGHAVRAVYMYAGMTDIAAAYRDTAYLRAVLALWKNMTGRKLYITGGVGALHKGEAFGRDYELPNLTAYNETCASIGSVLWNHRLFMLTGDAKYIDVLERTLYNGLLSGISLDGKTFFYPNPLEADGKYAFNMGAHTRQSWFDCSCCPTNLIRFVPSIPGLVYAAHEDTVYVNLYMSNTAHVAVGGTDVVITQRTGYPWEGRVTIAVEPEKRMQFTVKLRIPGWARNEPVPGDLYSYLGDPAAAAAITVNGKAAAYELRNGYAELTRSWVKGDGIEVVLPMEIRRVAANEMVKEDRGRVAIEHGPIVYCAEEADQARTFAALHLADTTVLNIGTTTIAGTRVNTIEGAVHGAPAAGNGAGGRKSDVRLIPYYAWSNRGVGGMTVWFPRTKK